MNHSNLVKEFGRDFSFEPKSLFDNSLRKLMEDCETVMTVEFEEWCDTENIDLTEVDVSSHYYEIGKMTVIITTDKINSVVVSTKRMPL